MDNELEYSQDETMSQSCELLFDSSARAMRTIKIGMEM